MKNRLFLFGLFLIPLALHAQRPTASGLIIDDAAYDQLYHNSDHIEMASGKRSLIPRLDLEKYCPEAKHQGDISSCVGWSVGYAAMSIERAVQNKWTDKAAITASANSALFVYNLVNKGDCSLGITISKALKAVQSKGNCLSRDYDVDVNDCEREISNNLLIDAANYKIQDFLPLFKSAAHPSDKINKVKLLLAQSKPVIVGMRVLNNFYQIRSGDESWLPKIGDTHFAGGHSMVVVGYDDNKFSSPLRKIPAGKRGAFKLMNSWGRDWGQNGFIWVRYADFAQFCSQAFAISLSNQPAIELDLAKMSSHNSTDSDRLNKRTKKKEFASSDSRTYAGTFGFQYYEGWDEGPVFEEAKVRLSNNQYNLLGTWRQYDKFQLTVNSGLENGFIYVFSIDASGKSEVHYPKQNQSALVWGRGSTLCIPGPNTALELVHSGQDHLIALFSISKIKMEYLDMLGSELSKHRKNVLKVLYELMGDHLVPQSDINYLKDTMGFTVSTTSECKIIPIILSVEVQ
jgi:hypothetical protein